MRRWAGVVGWEVLLNRAGTTFRGLPDADKIDLDEAKAIKLMLANPSMIKRPVLEQGGTLLVGFKPDTYASAGLGAELGQAAGIRGQAVPPVKGAPGASRAPCLIFPVAGRSLASSAIGGG